MRGRFGKYSVDRITKVFPVSMRASPFVGFFGLVAAENDAALIEQIKAVLILWTNFAS